MSNCQPGKSIHASGTRNSLLPSPVSKHPLVSTILSLFSVSLCFPHLYGFLVGASRSARHELAALSTGSSSPPLIPLPQSQALRYHDSYPTNTFQVNAHDEEDGPHSYQLNSARSDLNPISPPPSFRSRSSSPSSRRLLHNDPLRNDDQELADAFGDEDDSDDDEQPDDRQRLMRANTDGWAPPDHTQTPTSSSSESRNNSQEPSRAAPGIPRRPTMLPNFTTPGSGGSRSVAPSNDGVFANLAAKPERGEKNEDLPPVSLIMSIDICVLDLLLMCYLVYSPMKKPPPMPHPHTGKPPLWHPASHLTKYTWTDCPLVPSSHLCGTP